MTAILTSLTEKFAAKMNCRGAGTGWGSGVGVGWGRGGWRLVSDPEKKKGLAVNALP